MEVGDNVSPEARPHSCLQRCFELLLRLGFAVLCLILLLSNLGRHHWMLDNLTAGLVQLTAVAGCFSLAFLLIRRWKWAFAAFIVLLATAFRLIPSSAPVANAAETPIRIVSANVLTSNRQFNRFIEFVQESDPDVLFVLEADRAWESALKQLRTNYPYAVSIPRQDNFGLLLLSRFPLAETETEHFGEASIPVVVAGVQVGSEMLTLVGAHPLPPVSRHHAHRRNEQLAAIGRLARGTSRPCLVIGDLNIAPWSPYFQELLEKSRLRDTRSGFNLGASWPTGNPLLMTPIDHALVSAGIKVIDRQMGPDIGSDHLPIILEIALSETDF